MKATELRLNNWILGVDGKEYQLDLPTLVYMIKNEVNDIEPIPLTEEILLKCGNSKFEGYYIKTKRGGAQLMIHKTGNNRFAFDFGTGVYYFDYVHEYQNLYFALTGEELKLEI